MSLRKRKLGEDDDRPTTGKERKKQRVFSARNIDTQDGSVAGAVNSLAGLPSSIDIEKFAEARAFEITAIENAMKSARASATQRVWQTLPRHLRRRAASHDVRRVPVRLRTKARLELKGTKKRGVKGKPRQGQEKRLSRTESLRIRQLNKTWLETHIWHAKRMRMEDLWGYRLAITPTEKSFRPSYRAAVNASILHDASYHSVIEMKGPQSVVKRVLELCCDPMGLGPGSARYISGTREYETFLYGVGQWPYAMIGPAKILWRADTNIVNRKPPVNAQNAPFKKKEWHSARTKPNPALVEEILPKADPHRTVWIRSHPAIFDEVNSALQAATSQVLEYSRLSPSVITAHPDDGSAVQSAQEVELNDLRDQLVVFDLIGPNAGSVLQGVMHLVPNQNLPEAVKAWKSMREVATAGSLPRGMLLALNVHDPRLSFPPRNRSPSITVLKSNPPIIFNPSVNMSHSVLWDQGVRDKLRIKTFQKSQLDQRRSKQMVPGTRLKPRDDDDQIPCLIIQRTLSHSDVSHDKSPSTSSARYEKCIAPLNGYTVVLPAGWGMPFLSSLIFTGTRIAGLCETRYQAFESQSSAAFPEDCVTSEAFQAYATMRAAKDLERWQKKPPAKRFNYDKILGEELTRGYNQWMPDWCQLLGISSSESPTSGQTLYESCKSNLISTQPRRLSENKASELSNIEKSPSRGLHSEPRPWRLRGCNTSSIIDECLSVLPTPDDIDAGSTVATTLHSRIIQLVEKRRPTLADGFGIPSPIQLLQTALVGVSVHIRGRGSPSDFAVLYSMTEHDIDLHIGGASTPELEDEIGNENPNSHLPPATGIIGFVTTGNFSLARGKGHGIGAISLIAYLKLAAIGKRYSMGPFVKVRNRDEKTWRVAVLSVLA